MNNLVDWRRKLLEAATQIKTGYDQIGRKTGAPHLAVVYPPEAEAAVFKEWRSMTAGLGSEFDVRTIDVLAVTMSVIEELGCEQIVDVISHPMPGSNPETELGQIWLQAVADQVKATPSQPPNAKVVIVLQYLAALYPVTSPSALMQQLWEGEKSAVVDCPAIFFIPGTLTQRRVYSFMNQREEFMYRGDIL